MPLRTRLFIIVSIITFFILSVSIFLLVQGKKRDEQNIGAPASNTVIDSANFNGVVESPKEPTTFVPPLKPLSTEEIEKNTAKQIAKIFLERYNSFSTQNNYQNIREVEALVTTDLWKRISGRLNTPQTATDFMAVTAEVLGVSLGDWKVGSSAEVVLDARKSTEKNGTVATVYDKTKVKLVKDGDTWLVNSFEILK